VRRYKSQKLRKVALLIETTRSYGRNVLRGVGDYARVHGKWLFYLPMDESLRSVPSREQWDGDGIIAQPHQNQALVKALAEYGKPVVSLSGPPGAGGLPSVLSNNTAVAELALKHFRDRGLKRFAYCAVPGEKGGWPNTGAAFQKAVEAAGFECKVHVRGLQTADRIMSMEELAGFLRTLEPPVGVLAANDLRAREVLDAARSVDIAVPEQLAVLGISDDELICELAGPPLSSVTHNARRIGFEAAQMLDKLMSGETGVQDVVVEPLGVSARQSTDLLAIEDQEVAAAMRFIRENACQGIQVDDVLEHVAISRRGLEKRFMKVVGRAPHEEIRRVQIEGVKTLLVTTDFKLERIAEAAGFSSAQYLASLFHRMTSMTPGAWRAAARSTS
jgi:LacI family transcriptional regulator